MRGGGNRYSTRGIPAAWVVSPDGKVIWEGNPLAYKAEIEKVIQEYLRDALPVPRFGLPRELRKIQALLYKGSFTKARKQLAEYIEEGEGDALPAAKDAAARLDEFLNAQQKRADEYAEQGHYTEAHAVLTHMKKLFKGSPPGDAANDRLKAWKKDKKIKAEIDAGKLYRVARDFIYADETDAATKVLSKIVKSKKYDGTQVQKRAQEKLKSLGVVR